MIKKELEEIAKANGVELDVAKKLYLAFCQELATTISNKETYRCPFFVVKAVVKEARTKQLSDGSEKQVPAKLFGRLTVK
jgi:hypothetical protein